MDISAKKIELMEWLLGINDEVKLKELLAFKSKIEVDAVAYDLQGKPISKKEYNSKVEEADARISSGNFTTMEDLEKEIQKW